MFNVVWPGVPDHTFFSSIVPWSRVLVNVHTTASPLPTGTALLAPTVTGAFPCAVSTHTSAGVYPVRPPTSLT